MRRRRALASLILLVLLGSCAGEGDDGSPLTETTPQVVTGLITEIESDRLHLRADDGRQLVFFIGEGAEVGDPPVSVTHLREHMEDRLPVRITYRVESSRLHPIAIDDA